MTRQRTFGIGQTYCLSCGAVNEISRYENGSLYYRCQCGFHFQNGNKAFCRQFVDDRVTLYPPETPPAQAQAAPDPEPQETEDNAPAQITPETDDAGRDRPLGRRGGRAAFLGRRRRD